MLWWMFWGVSSESCGEGGRLHACLSVVETVSQR